MRQPTKRVKDVRYYVNNRDLNEALLDYRNKCREAVKNDTPKPRIPNYIGDCILKICTRITFKPNWVNYTYKDEMISDAYYTCIKYLHNFDPERSSTPNPFAYFTSVAQNCFKQRVAKEKKQIKTREKILEVKGFAEVFCDDNVFGNNDSDYNTMKDNIYLKQKYN